MIKLIKKLLGIKPKVKVVRPPLPMMMTGGWMPESARHIYESKR